MNYGYFIKNLPLELVQIIDSFVNPKTDYYVELLKERVKKFCSNGMFRIEEHRIERNSSYFHKKEFIEEFDEKPYRLNINKNIEQIIIVRDIFKKIYKPMTKQTKSSYHLKHVIEELSGEYISNGIMIMALILLGVKYSKRYPQDTIPEFYCGHNDEVKKLLNKIYKKTGNKFILQDVNIKKLLKKRY